MSYRLGVANIYELLSDDGGEGVIVPPQQKKVETAPAQPKAVAPSSTSSQQQKPVSKPKAQTDRPKTDRPQSENGKGPRRERPPRQQGEGSTSTGEGSVEDRDRRRRDRPEGARGPRADRPPRERRELREAQQGQESSDGFRGNKRIFDRRSGTGRSYENKKGGSGKANWGTFNDDRSAQEEGTTDVTDEAKAENTGNPETAQGETTQEGTEKKEGEATKEQEKEPDPDEKLKTLDEFLKEKKKPQIDLPPPRKAGEGEKSSTWSNYVPLKKEDDSAFAIKKEEVEPEEKKAKDASKPSVRVDDVLDIKFQEERRGYGRGRDRGERGERSERSDRSDRGRENREGGQRRGGSGKGRGKQNQNQTTPNFRDESSFPALSTKA